MSIITHKGIQVAKSSALGQAIITNRPPQEINNIFKDTTERFMKLYGPTDAAWFMSQGKESA